VAGWDFKSTYNGVSTRIGSEIPTGIKLPEGWVSPRLPSDSTASGLTPDITGAVIRSVGRGVGEARGSTPAETTLGPAAAANKQKRIHRKRTFLAKNNPLKPPDYPGYVPV